MLDQAKSNQKSNEKKRNGQKAVILSAAIATLVASGEKSSDGAPTLADDALTISVDENQSVVVKVEAEGADGLTFAISGDDADFLALIKKMGLWLLRLILILRMLLIKAVTIVITLR